MGMAILSINAVFLKSTFADPGFLYSLFTFISCWWSLWTLWIGYKTERLYLFLTEFIQKLSAIVLSSAPAVTLVYCRDHWTRRCGAKQVSCEQSCADGHRSHLKMAAFTHFWQIITTEGYQNWSVWHLSLGSYGQSFGICAIFKKLVGRLGRRHDLRWTLKEQVLKSKREKQSVG